MRAKKNHTRTLKEYLAHLSIAGILLLFLIWTLLNFMYRKPIDTATIMARDIAMLATIFERIEKECGIISFDYQSNPINFLNIKNNGFVGSEVGSMNLAHPEKWQGPYLQDNLAIQQKDYQVIRTDKGYFIVPGQGVKLPSGKIIGKDLILDEKADIPAMMNDTEKLMFEGKPLAAPLITETMPINSKFVAALASDASE